MTLNSTGASTEKPRRKGNGNDRGSSYDRRARRAFIIETFASESGKTIACFHCKKKMRVETKTRTWEIDRFPVCGHLGGKYTRDNIVPSCLKCNRTRCTVKCRAGYSVPRVIGESTAPTVPIEIVVDVTGEQLGDTMPPDAPLEVVHTSPPVAPPTAEEVAESTTDPSLLDPPTGDLALNEKERAVLRVLAGEAKPLQLAELATRVFPENPKGNSWVRNSLRRLRRHGLARRFAKGTYEIAQLAIRGAS